MVDPCISKLSGLINTEVVIGRVSGLNYIYTGIVSARFVPQGGACSCGSLSFVLGCGYSW